MRALIPLFFLVACSPTGAILIDEGTTDDTTPVDTTPGDTENPDDTEDPEDTEDTEEPEDTEPAFAHTGDYEGMLESTLSSSWGGYELEPCETTATVSEDGELEGEALCALGGGWGGGDEEPTVLPFSGTVSEDGIVTGQMEYDFQSDYVELDSLDIEGEISEDGEMVLELYGEAVSDWLTVEIIGDAELERL